MPLELGVFIGATRFGDTQQKRKRTLIIDCEKYRYQKFISDIAGQDICAHKNTPAQAITCIRNWLNSASRRKTIPGGAAIYKRYQKFQQELPQICHELELELTEVTYNDYCNFVSGWLKT